MPKQKTHKATRKRVKITGSGRVKRHRAGARHLLSGKSAKRKRHLKRPGVQEGAEATKLAKLVRGL
jgi:large subunit ribosomal protein L35